MTNLAELRAHYGARELREELAPKSPFELFAKWFEEAKEAYPREPNAMTLATATAGGEPSARTVLLKGLDERGFMFYSNYESRKGQELHENPRASLLFYWADLERQIRINGTVSRLDRSESENYFHSRPFGSQIGAWVSPQSTVIPNRQFLDDRVTALTLSYEGRPVPLPPFWGGYVLHPTMIEFWQGRPNRLHDRLRYTRKLTGGWVIDRLAP